MNRVNYKSNETVISATNLNEMQDEIISLKNQIKTLQTYSNPKNLLDNSNFMNPVAQAGYLKVHGDSDTPYICDRWIGTSTISSVTKDNTLNINVNSSSIGWMTQNIDSSYIIKGQPYTLALCTDKGIDIISGTIPTTTSGTSDINLFYGDFYSHNYGLRLKYNPTKDFYFVTIRLYKGFTASLKWAALYPGIYDNSTLPSYQKKTYEEELRACQAYYYRLDNTSDGTAAYEAYETGTIRDSNRANFLIHFPVKMRKIPSFKA